MCPYRRVILLDAQLGYIFTAALANMQHSELHWKAKHELLCVGACFHMCVATGHHPVCILCYRFVLQ